MEIVINVGSDILYVGGTVNGIEYVFESLGFGTFRKDVPKSEDDLYHLDLQLVDEAGNTSDYKKTFEYYLPAFIFDRTQKDIDERTKKAFINSSDLNRIDRNTLLIGEYIGISVNTKTDWNIGGLPRHSDYQRIKEKKKKIRDGYVVWPDTPEVPDRPYNTYQKWNDIEKILHDVFFIYIRNYNNKTYCGEGFSCGDEIGVI